MKPTQLFLFVRGLLLCFILLSPAHSLPALALDPSPYELTSDSQYIEGCYEPCLCPIFSTQTLQGSFQLVPVSQDESNGVFEILAIDWQLILWDEVVSVSGSGIYLVEDGQHRLTLDLLVGEDPVQTFDSGLVSVPDEIPGLAIAVALNEFYCYDYVFDIKAIPATVDQENPAWGSLKSYYR